MKTWCRHISWHHDRGYTMTETRWDFVLSFDKGRKWNFCPICGAKRPTKKKGK